VERVPYEWFALLRHQSPVHWQPEPRGRGFWSLVRYDDVVAAHKDWETFSNELGGTSLEDLAPEHLEARKSMLDMDPPEHTKLRAILSKGFTPRVIAAYEERIRDLARRVIAEAFARESFDLVRDVAVEIPIRVFIDMLGAPVEDRLYLVELGNRMLGNTDPEFAGEEVADKADLSRYAHLPFSSPAAAEMFAYGHALAEARRREPREDITTTLVEAEVDGRRLTEREFDVFFLLLTIAGNETTRHAITSGALALLEHPDELARLAADPSLAATGADEVLRWSTPVYHFRRTATRDVELHGQTIRRGDKVVTWYISANFDEEQFPEAMRFDLSRAPNRHVSFGLGGPHFCLGAHLARLELRIVFEELAPLLPGIELAGLPERLRSNFFNGIKRMPVRRIDV
jgi:cytochrome P450